MIMAKELGRQKGRFFKESIYLYYLWFLNSNLTSTLNVNTKRFLKQLQNRDTKFCQTEHRGT